MPHPRLTHNLQIVKSKGCVSASSLLTSRQQLPSWPFPPSGMFCSAAGTLPGCLPHCLIFIDSSLSLPPLNVGVSLGFLGLLFSVYTVSLSPLTHSHGFTHQLYTDTCTLTSPLSSRLSSSHPLSIPPKCGISIPGLPRPKRNLVSSVCSPSRCSHHSAAAQDVSQPFWSPSFAHSPLPHQKYVSTIFPSPLFCCYQVKATTVSQTSVSLSCTCSPFSTKEPEWATPIPNRTRAHAFNQFGKSTQHIK